MNKPFVIKAAFLFLLLIAGFEPEVCRAQSQSEVYSFARELFQSGKYEAAITEYMRFGWLYPQSKLVWLTRYKIGLSYLAEGNPELGRKYLERLLNDERTPFNMKYQAQLTLAKSYIREGENNLAELEFNDLLTYPLSEGQLTKLRFWKGWNFLAKSDFAHARREFAKIKGEKVKNFYTNQASALAQESSKGMKFPDKSPKVAKWLSTFLPGAGQIYCGKIGQGLISAILNGTLGYITIRAIRDKRYYEGSALYLFVWSRYYWGSRYNAVRFTRMYNAKKKREFLHSLITKHLKNLPPSTCPFSLR